jgi:hypothetical protein
VRQKQPIAAPIRSMAIIEPLSKLDGVGKLVKEIAVDAYSVLAAQRIVGCVMRL